jgi:hypothetical protein
MPPFEAIDQREYSEPGQLAPDRLAKVANKLDSLFGGYDLATPEKERAPISLSTP